jgi:hypothetical protein
MNVALYGWKEDDFYAETYFIGYFETYEEAIKEGDRLVAIGELVDYDTYVV